MSFVDEQSQFNPHWSSLSFSQHLSIGRLYRTQDLNKLVDLILIAYNRQVRPAMTHSFSIDLMALEETVTDTVILKT